MKTVVLCAVALVFVTSGALAQILAPNGNKPPVKPEDTEVYEPVVGVVKAGKTFDIPPSDAVILFDGKNLDEWESSRQKTPAIWKVEGGVFTVDKRAGDIQTKKTFTNYQLHIEYRIPDNITGTGQGRGNSGVFLAATRGKAGGMRYRYWTAITMRIKPM